MRDVSGHEWTMLGSIAVMLEVSGDIDDFGNLESWRITCGFGVDMHRG